MTDHLDLDALAELERKATEGPWYREVCHSDPKAGDDSASIMHDTGSASCVKVCDWWGGMNGSEPDNINLIVFLRNHARTLIAEARRARALEEYARHNMWCLVPDRECCCGLSALLSREDERG